MSKTLVFLVALSVAIVGFPSGALAQNPTPGTPKDSFADVPVDHWAYQGIMALRRRGVITGYGDGTFRPNASVARVEFAKMMVLALNLTLADAAAPTFDDVAKDNWAYRYVETARYYLTGFQTPRGDYFKPADPAVREDMAVALVKALGLGYAGEAEDDSALKGFTDAAEISANLRKYVAMAVRKGVMLGYPDSGSGRVLKPMESLTRAEAAVLLCKLPGAEVEVKVTHDSGPGRPSTSTGSYPVPVVTAVADGPKVIVSWQANADSRFQGYKVVISMQDPEPAYPENGYLTYITERSTTSAAVNNSQAYNSGDFGQYLVPGQAYYFSVTAVYGDCNVAGNAVRLVYPGP